MTIPFIITLFTLLVVQQCVGNKQITVIGPRTITSEPTYKAFLNADGLSSDDILVLALKSQNAVHKTRKFTGRSNFNEQIEFDLPASPHDSYNLMSLLVTKSKNGKNICTVKEAKIHSSSTKNFFNLIQMDKPIYKAGDKVRFRVLTLDHETKPYKYDKIKVTIYHSNTSLVRTFSEARKSDYGLYENSFTIPDEPVFGNWDIEVEIDQAKSRKTFIVKDYKPPPFQVFVETQPRVAYENGFNPSIILKISAKYPFDKFVKGFAKITAKVFNINLPGEVLSEKSREVRIDGGSENVKFELKNDLDMQFLTTTGIVEFEIDFIEDGTKRKVQQSQKVEVLPKGHHIIKLTNQDQFRPGFAYKVKAEVFTLDGKPVKSESLPITMKLKYNFKEETLSNSSITHPSFLKKGKAYFDLNPSTDVVNFTMSFKFENAEVTKVIEAKKQNGDELMQVTFDPEYPKVDDTLKIKAQSNSLMNPLKVLVVGRKGLIYSKEFSNADGTDEFDFELTVTKDMAPEASVIVFYVRETDGEIIYDQFKLELGFTSTNELTIEPSSKTFKPKETASFTLKSEPKSLIGLLAIDQSIRYLGNKNDISLSEVDLKVTSLGKLKAESYDGTLYADLVKSNVFVLQPLRSTKHLCKPSEENYFEDNFVGRLKVISMPDEDEEIPEWEDTSIETFTSGDDLVRKYFPDVWIFQTIDMQQGQGTFNKSVPDTVTSWYLSGFSINAEKGLAIAKPQEMKVFQDFFIKVEAPNSVKIGEILKIDVTVHNYLDDDKTVEITLQQDNFELVDERQIYGRPEGCMEYSQTNLNSKRVRANSKSGATTEFLVKPIKSGKINLKVDAKAGQGVQDSVQKYIKVDYEGATQFKSNSMLIDLTNTTRFSEDINIEIPRDAEPETVKIESSLSGNLLGPALDNVEKFISMPEGCGEQKMKSFALSIYAYKYLTSINSTNATLIDNALNAIHKGYQEAKLLQGHNGSFKLWGKSEDSEGIWLSAYVTQLLGDARELIKIDEDFYTNSLEHLKSKQKSSGYFDDDSKGPRQDQGSLPGRKTYLTAFIMIAIAKNKKTYDDFAFINFDAAQFLKTAARPYDFEKAIVAYALSLADEKDEANKVLDSINWGFSKLKSPAVKALHVEVASYIILAAIKLERFEDAMKAFNFLIKQRQPNGGFFSTHDTVLGLEALTAMQEYLGAQSPSMNFQFSGGIREDIESQTDSKYVELNPQLRAITVEANGGGMAYVNVFYQYKTKSSLSNNFIIKLDPIQETENGIKMKFKVGSNRATSNMGIVEVELPSGYEYTNGNFTNDVKKIEFDDDKTKVILYFESITGNTINNLQIIEATKIADIKEPKKSIIKAYDYYEPDQFKTNLVYDLKKELKCNGPTVRSTTTTTLRPAVTWTNNKPTVAPFNQWTNNKPTQAPVNPWTNLKTTVAPITNAPLRNNFIEQQDEFLDIRYTAFIAEILWDYDRSAYYKAYKCPASIINKQTVLTASANGCQFTNDLGVLRVIANVWSEEAKKYIPMAHSVKFIKSYADVRVLHLVTPIGNLPELELFDSQINLEGAKCITSSLNTRGELTQIVVKLMSNSECYNILKINGRICTSDLLDPNNHGNSLVCNVDGKLYQVGIGMGVTQQGIAVYRNIRGWTNWINSIVSSQG